VCFDRDSLPPVPVISGASVSHDELVLDVRDGNRLAAFAATPDDPSSTGIVILPDVRGLYRFYEELALRFAERGHAAIAIDYFGRTAGVSKRDDEFEYRPHVERTTPAGVQTDTAAGVAWLREAGSQSIFTVGFCFGGRHSWLAAAGGHGLAGAIGFYGSPVGPGRGGSPAPADLADQIEAPILGLFGGADPGIPSEAIAAFDAALERAGVEHRLVTYPNAPHSFFDRNAAQREEESRQARAEVLTFVRDHTGRGPA
jgi:carboxymethylenebutenolidase